MSTTLLEPQHPHVDPVAAHARARPRRRWEVWRSPAAQPAWARPALLGIAAVAALVYGWNVAHPELESFYWVAAKSESESWKAFFYGAFDPKATITLDKLAGSFLPQALAARIFGFHPWSLALPQVIEGVVSVLVMYRVVRRWAGVASGLLAALIFALTPIVASMFGHSMEDAALTMCLVLAADAYQRAVLEGRLTGLLMAGLWVGLGFQAKMLQAWMILPALVLGYLLCAPPSWPRRLRHVAVFGLVTLAVSLSWIALYTVTPAASRPYIDGSVDNNAFAMVFGYNGLDRFGISVPGSVTSWPGLTAGPGGYGSHGAGGFGTGWTKLLGSTYGPQIGWLYPLAVLALICGLLWTRRARRDDPVRGGFVLWGLWLLTFFLILSKMGTIPHTAYVASLAPPLAALSGAGTVMFWRVYRAGSGRSWMLPIVVAASLAWAAFLWHSYGGFLPWARDAALAAGIAAVIIIVGARQLRETRLPVVTAGLACGVVAMLAAPATWAASVLDVKYAGNSLEASAGPDNGGLSWLVSGRPQAGHPDGAGANPGGLQESSDPLTTTERQIYGYVSARRHGADYLMAVSSWTQALPYIIATGQEVMSIGGFTGSVPSPTLAEVQKRVRTGQLRFFLLSATDTGPAAFLFGQHNSSPTMTAIESWVKSACAAVPARDYGAVSSAASSVAQTLYACR
ncbi:MAG TPA: glycosyltransferase family 39 protein [Trebonia sp.]|nr:glycosyltransferase family 39 protein [Trebonia sp.]